ncbi:MAG: VWA domain-containing protein [Dehalococcoidia bacterium]|nr:VWA domain-containing protein [Dehalococcoidia bacterium]
MEFRDPLFLALLLILVPLALLMRPRRSGLPVASTAGLAAHRTTWRLRAARVMPLLRLLAIAVLIVAVARPRTGEAETVIPAEGIDIALSLDLSGSMRNERFGVAGVNRLEGARLVVNDFIDTRPDDRIGVVAFQRDAIPVSPPTLDHDALQTIIDDLEPGLLPDGTALGLGLAAAVNMLEESSAPSRVVILLTDGEHNADETISPGDATELARSLDVRVYTIGITARTTVGPRGVEADQLTSMAESTGGQFFEASTVEDLADVYEEIGRLETSSVERERFIEYREYGPWLGMAAVLLIASEALLRTTLLRRVEP